MPHLFTTTIEILIISSISLIVLFLFADYITSYVGKFRVRIKYHGKAPKTKENLFIVQWTMYGIYFHKWKTVERWDSGEPLLGINSGWYPQLFKQEAAEDFAKNLTRAKLDGYYRPMVAERNKFLGKEEEKNIPYKVKYF